MRRWIGKKRKGPGAARPSASDSKEARDSVQDAFPPWSLPAPSLPSGTSESARAPSRVGQLSGLLHVGGLEASKHQLGDAFAPGERNIGIGQISENHLQLAPIVRIDRARRVGHDDALAECQARSGTHLALHLRRKLHHQPGGHGPGFPGPQNQVFLGRTDIVPRGTRSGPTRKGKVGVVRKPPETNARTSGHASSTGSTGVDSSPKASATPSYVMRPLTTFTPSFSAESSLHAVRHPLFANVRA